MAKRRLEDLFVRGDFVTFDDGKGEPVTVWLQKLSPVETNNALRRANAARARVRSVKSDPTSDEYMDMWLEVLSWETKADLVEYLLAEPQSHIEQRVEAELATEEEWAAEGYLQGLRDAWLGGAQAAYIVDPESPEGIEGARILAEIDRFAAEARVKCEPEIAAARAQLEEEGLQELQSQAMDRIIRYRASAAWLNEMKLCEIFYGTHDAVPDAKVPGKMVATHTKYWPSRADFDRVSNQVLGPLLTKYEELSVDVLEGKDSEGTPTSSTSSGSQPEPETEASSGLVAVGQ